MILYIDCCKFGFTKKQINNEKRCVIELIKYHFNFLHIEYGKIFKKGNKGIYICILGIENYMVLTGGYSVYDFGKVKIISYIDFYRYFYLYKKLILKYQRGPVIQINLSYS